MALDLSPWSPALIAYAGWLEAENGVAAKNWSKRLKSSESSKAEGAVAEAVVKDFIGCRCDATHLAEHPDTGGVDFEFVANGTSFLVEVTNLSIQAAADASKMPDKESLVEYYALLTARIRQKVRGKLEQAQKIKHPLLIAVTTLHQNASRACVDRRAVEFAMGSTPRITMDWNPDTGMSEGEPYQSTDLAQSVFLSPKPILGPDGQPIAQARYQPIYGFLLAGFGVNPSAVRMYGGLNPEAKRPFDAKLLSDIPFCFFSAWPVSTSLAFSWTISEEAEEKPRQEATERRLRGTVLGQLADEVREEIRRRRAREKPDRPNDRPSQKRESRSAHRIRRTLSFESRAPRCTCARWHH